MGQNSQRNGVDDGGCPPTRRHDDTTTRRPVGLLRVLSPLDPELEALVTRIMDCAFKVHRHLGPGFKERIYTEALCLEFDASGLSFERGKSIDVVYRDWRIPGQRVDLVVGGKVLVEVKAVPSLRPLHQSQVFSYLKTMNLRIALIINFNCRLLKYGLKRVVR